MLSDDEVKRDEVNCITFQIVYNLRVREIIATTNLAADWQRSERKAIRERNFGNFFFSLTLLVYVPLLIISDRNN